MHSRTVNHSACPSLWGENKVEKKGIELRVNGKRDERNTGVNKSDQKSERGMTVLGRWGDGRSGFEQSGGKEESEGMGR